MLNRGRKRSYIMNILIGLDQFVGTLWGIDSDETISSWVGRNKPGKWQEKTINFIFRHIAKQENHCKKSIGT